MIHYNKTTIIKLLMYIIDQKRLKTSKTIERAVVLITTTLFTNNFHYQL